MFQLSLSEFVDGLREVQMPSHRRNEKDSPVSQQEQTELRGQLGGHGWKCERTGPQHSDQVTSQPTSPTSQEMEWTSFSHLQLFPRRSDQL